MTSDLYRPLPIPHMPANDGQAVVRDFRITEIDRQRVERGALEMMERAKAILSPADPSTSVAAPEARLSRLPPSPVPAVPEVRSDR